MYSLDVLDRHTMMIELSNIDDKETLKKIGAGWNPNIFRWVLPLSIWNIEWLRDNLKQDYQYSSTIQDFIALRKDIEHDLEQTRQLILKNNDIPFRIKDFKINPYPYQKLGICYGISHPSGIIIGDEPGLGKTCQAIGIASFLKSRNLIKNCLIITPASLKWNWPIEIDKFTNETYTVIDGKNPQERIERWSNDTFFHIANFELIVEDLFCSRSVNIKASDTKKKMDQKLKKIQTLLAKQEKLKFLVDRGWDCIIVDEAHYIKTHTSKRTKCVKALGQKSRYRFALTGTPLDGCLEDIHSIVEFVDPSVFPPINYTLHRYAIMNQYIPGKVDKYIRIDEFKERIKYCFIRRRTKEVLKDLPDIIPQDRFVELSQEERTIYDKLKTGKLSETTSKDDINPMVLALRLKQFCDHPSLIGFTELESAKYKAFKETLEEIVINNGHKVLVFTQYTTMAEKLINILEELNLKYMYICGDTDKKERADMQAKFNDDKSIDVMLGTDAMSVGLNFTAADVVINYDDAWSPSVMSQRAKRCHRINQKNTVLVINYVCRNTIEERIRHVLLHKTEVINSIADDSADEVILQKLSKKAVKELL